MNVKEFYAATGGDYEGTLSRFLSEERVKRFALKFEQDPSFSQLCEALKNGDVGEAFRAAHTLKGVCQNLGFDSLYRISSEITEILRGGSLNVDQKMPALKTCYGTVMTALRALKED